MQFNPQGRSLTNNNNNNNLTPVYYSAGSKAQTRIIKSAQTH